MLLDANALLLPVRSRFPLEAEVDRLHPGARLAVPSSVADELARLALRSVPGARAAVALAGRYPIVSVEGRGDRAVLHAAVDRHAWVVTADRAFAERLQRVGVTVLVPRDRHRLERRPGRASTSSRPPAPLPAKTARRRQRL